MGRYTDTAKWAKSRNLAQIMASSTTTGGRTRVKKRKTKALGDIFVVQRWS